MRQFHVARTAATPSVGGAPQPASLPVTGPSRIRCRTPQVIEPSRFFARRATRAKRGARPSAGPLTRTLTSRPAGPMPGSG